MLFKPFNEFFRKNHFFPKNPNFERFEISWVLLTFETHSIWNEPCIMILKNFNYFFLKTHPFSQNKRKYWQLWEILNKLTLWDVLWWELTKFIDFENGQGLSAEKPMNFSKKNPTFECLEVCQLKIPLETLFKKVRPCAATLKNFRFFLEKNPSIFTGKPKFWMFSL